jgi:tubulin beta
MEAGQCGNQMCTTFWKAVCDERGFGGGGEYCGDNDAQLGHTNVFYYEASGGKYVPRSVLFDIDPGVIGAERTSPLVELLCPSNIVIQNANAVNNWAKSHYKRAG